MNNMAQASAEQSLSALWVEMSALIRSEVSTDTWTRWFRETTLAGLSETELVLRVPNKIYQFWIEDNYLPLLHSAILLKIGSPRTVGFLFKDSAAAVPTASGGVAEEPAPPAAPAPVPLAPVEAALPPVRG